MSKTLPDIVILTPHDPQDSDNFWGEHDRVPCGLFLYDDWNVLYGNKVIKGGLKTRNEALSFLQDWLAEPVKLTGPIVDWSQHEEQNNSWSTHHDGNHVRINYNRSWSQWECCFNETLVKCRCSSRPSAIRALDDYIRERN